MAGLGLQQGGLVAGRYRLIRHLGEGGMGTVWSAVHVVTRRAVALKFLRENLQDRPDLRKRFVHEARAASAFSHPNAIQILDVFELSDESPAMVMELLEGETLGQKISRQERLSVDETAEILAPVARAVAHAHAAGVIHRDLKPENIFLAQTAEGLVVKVLDFGIAKLSAEHFLDRSEAVALTGAGCLLGTPRYMAPEQVSNEGVDYRADVWSLGTILYECLSGTRPIEGNDIGQAVARLLGGVIVPLAHLAPQLPAELTGMVQQMLLREPSRRPADLMEIARVLERHVSHAHRAAQSTLDDSWTGNGPIQSVNSPVRVQSGVTKIQTSHALGTHAQHGSPEPPVTRPPSARRERSLLGLTIVLCLSICSALGYAYVARHFTAPLAAATPSAAKEQHVQPDARLISAAHLPEHPQPVVPVRREDAGVEHGAGQTGRPLSTQPRPATVRRPVRENRASENILREENLFVGRK